MSRDCSSSLDADDGTGTVGLASSLACATVTGTCPGDLVGLDVSVSGVVRYLAPRNRTSCVVGVGVVVGGGVGLGVVEVVVVVVVVVDVVVLALGGRLALTATVDDAAGVCVGVTKKGPIYLGFFVGPTVLAGAEGADGPDGPEGPEGAEGGGCTILAD